MPTRSNKIPDGNLYLHKGIRNTRHGNYLFKYNSFPSYYYISLKDYPLFKVKVITVKRKFYTRVNKIYENRSTKTRRGK